MTTKPKILFVDDEENILTSLRLSLRPMHAKWDFSFALGAQEALSILAGNPHEVVVTDMRMPGIDGAQLLKEVQQLYPESMRIILSGYSTEESVLKTVELAHQYLNKPCRPMDLIQAIDKALGLRDILISGRFKSVIARLETLPTLPVIYNQLVSTLQDENTTLKQVGDIVSQDVGMSASILRLVNSAFFGLPMRVSSIHHAVNLLGGETLRVLVLTTHLFTSLKQDEKPAFSVKKLWEHSIRVAGFAKAIAENADLPSTDREDSFIAGMLHDIGKLVLATEMRREFDEVLAKVRADNCPLHLAEREILGITHAEVGAYLLGLWGFNSPHLAAVCWHHFPEKLNCLEPNPTLVVHVANSLDHELVRFNPDHPRRPLQFESQECASVRARLGQWQEVCARMLDGKNGT